MKHFEEILKSLGAQSAKELAESKHWTLWEAEYSTPVQIIKGAYLYLKSSCPLSEATPKNLSDFSALCGAKGYQVIVTPSSDLAKDLAATKSKFRGANCHTTQQLLQDNLLKGVKYKPLQREEHFIAPSISLENNQLEANGLQFLSNWLLGKSSSGSDAPIALLTADGGTGKTTVARELCESVRQKYPKILPLLIEADQWKSIANTGFTLDTLWDIAIARRLENCNALRSNHSALRVLMQEGLLVVIFDGFDELAAASGDAHRPQEIISELLNLFTPEDEDVQAKVILTSRATYWTSIQPSLTSDEQIQVFRLNGFNNQQRKAYFDARLANQGNRDTAMRIAKQVSGPLVSGDSEISLVEENNRDRLSGTPFVLSLIAHYVEDNNGEDLNPYENDPLEPLLVGVCRRENKRQELKISPEKQIEIFEEIFRLGDDVIHQKDIDFILQMYDIGDAEVQHRFLNHFYLQRINGNTFVARFEILKVYFVARFLAKGLQKLYRATPEQEIATMLSRHFMGESQVIEWLVWQLKKLSDDRIVMAIQHAIKIINSPENIASRSKASIALSRIVLQLVNGDDKIERAESFFQLFGSHTHADTRILKGVTISGRIRGIDLTKTLFESCTFIDSEFQNCKFSIDTKFSNCIFDGTLDIIGSDNVSSAIATECRYSPDAEITWGKFFTTQPSERVRMDFAEEALTKALKKFKGDYGFHAIQYRRRNNSINPRNPYNAAIWEILKQLHVIETHNISGVSEGGLNIRDEKEIRREIVQYLDNGIVGPTFQNVISRIIG